MIKKCIWRRTLLAALSSFACSAGAGPIDCSPDATLTPAESVHPIPSGNAASMPGDGAVVLSSDDEPSWAQPYVLWHREAAGDQMLAAALFEAPPLALGQGQASSLAALDGMRGGFTRSDGLQISFGIERAVRINGELVTTTILSLPDASTLQAANTPVVVQNGPGNVALLAGTGAAQSGVPLVVQNTLDGQHIETSTIVNASVNSLQMLRAVNLSESIRESVIAAVRR